MIEAASEALSFDAPAAELFARLPELAERVDFGVIGIDALHRVQVYNAAESRLAGLSPERTLGRRLFEEVAPCMNNFMVAQRLSDEAELDAVVPYVFTLRMAPRRVELRLLRHPSQALRYVLVRTV